MGKKYYKKSRSGAKFDGYRGALLKMLPVVLMAGQVPLIVKQYKYETGLAQYSWFSMAEVDYEFFLAPKAVVLMLLAFVMAGCVAVRLWKERKEIPFAKVMLPLFAYGILCFLSACFSVNPSFSFLSIVNSFTSFLSTCLSSKKHFSSEETTLISIFSISTLHFSIFLLKV